MNWIKYSRIMKYLKIVVITSSGKYSTSIIINKFTTIVKRRIKDGGALNSNTIRFDSTAFTTFKSTNGCQNICYCCEDTYYSTRG